MVELAPGTVVAGKYRILGVLGTGAMGVVYRAEQLDAEGRRLREVALKTMQPSLSSDASFAKRFLREVRIAASLSSPNVVTVYDAGRTEDGALYFTMELVRGRTLRELLDQVRPLPVGRAVGIVAQICDALAEAHGAAEPIVHRDLKPANVFVEERRGGDRTKVNDFGIAKVIGEETGVLTSAGASPGTPRYMPPEQWRGEAIDGRADLYALGVIFYECLGGTPPFSGTIEQLMYKHLNEPAAPLPDSVPGPLRELVAKMLAKRPEDRPRDALFVKHVLDGIELPAASAEAADATMKLEGVAGRSATVPDAPSPRPGISAGRLAVFSLVLAIALAALLAVARWSSTAPQRIAERRPAATIPPIPTVETVPTAPPRRSVETAVPTPIAPPTVAPPAATVASAPIVGSSTKGAMLAPTEVPSCDLAPFSEADAKRWVDAYRLALVEKDIGKLRELGAVRSSAEADKLKRRLDPLRDLQVEIADLEIVAQGPRAELSFSLSERWRDPHQPSLVFDFDAEKRVLGRQDCRVVALP